MATLKKKKKILVKIYILAFESRYYMTYFVLKAVLSIQRQCIIHRILGLKQQSIQVNGHYFKGSS